MCGSGKSLEIGLEKLLKRTGARTELKRFRHTVKAVAATNHLPDYEVSFDEERDIVVFSGRGTIMAAAELAIETLAPLSPDTYHEARRAAPGWDVYQLEREWREWLKKPPRNPDGAFIGFCRSVFAKRGSP